MGGILLQEDDSSDKWFEVRRVLERIDRTIRYPHHAAHLNQPAFYPAAWRLAESEARKGHPKRILLEQAASVLDRAAGTPGASFFLRRYREHLEAGTIPDVKHLRGCTGWLMGNQPVIYGELFAHKGHIVGEVRQVIAEMARTYGPARCLAIAAVDTGSRHLSQAEPVAPPDRYLNLLTALFERVYTLLRSDRGEGQEVRVRVERLNVKSPRFPGSGFVRKDRDRVPLMAQDIAVCVREAEQFPFIAPEAGQSDGQVRIVPNTPSAKSPFMHPGLVLADTLVNVLRSTLDWGIAPPLHHVIWTMDEVFHLPITMQALGFDAGDKVSTLSCAGIQRQLIRQAFQEPAAASTLQVRAEATVPAWAREQAKGWISMVEKIR